MLHTARQKISQPIIIEVAIKFLKFDSFEMVTLLSQLEHAHYSIINKIDKIHTFSDKIKRNNVAIISLMIVKKLMYLYKTKVKYIFILS